MDHLLISIKLAFLAVVFVSFLYQNTIHFSNGVSYIWKPSLARKREYKIIMMKIKMYTCIFRVS